MSGTLAEGAALSLGLSGIKGISSPMNFESIPAFTIKTAKGIPDKSLIRTENTSRNRMGSLTRMPNHKQGTEKFDKSVHDRSIAPLTSEDINQFGNLSLMSSLRTTQPSVSNNRNKSVVIDNPPSFYEDDVKKRMEKYAKAIKDRSQFKRQYFSNERKTILAGNDNF